MTSNSLLGLLVLSTGIVTGCNGLNGVGLGSCTLIGCDDGVYVNFGPIMTVHAGALPLTLDLCLDDGCGSATLQLSGPDVQACSGSEPGNPCCTINPGATDFVCEIALKEAVRILLPLPASASTGDSHTVYVKVRGKSGELLMDAHQTVTLAAFQPNGPDCGPACHNAGADFSSTVP